MDAFLWLKMRFSFSVNVYIYIYSYGAFLLLKWGSYLVLMYMYVFLGCFFMVKIVKLGFSFGVNEYKFIPMVLFYC